MGFPNFSKQNFKIFQFSDLSNFLDKEFFTTYLAKFLMMFFAKANKMMFNSVLEEKRCKPKIVFVQFWCSLKVRKSQKQFFLNSITQKANDIFEKLLLMRKGSLFGQLLFEIGILLFEFSLEQNFSCFTQLAPTHVKSHVGKSICTHKPVFSPPNPNRCFNSSKLNVF